MNFFNFEGNRKRAKIENMSPKRRRFREISLLVILFLLIVMGALSFYNKKSEAGDYVVVTVAGEEYARYSLSQSRKVNITIEGVETNQLVIRDYSAEVKAANCPDKICVNTKAIHKDGETIVCLPNKVVIEVHSDTNKSELDATAQ